MVRKPNEQAVKYNEKMRGGEGVVKAVAMLSAEEMYNKGRLYSKLILPPGASIGYHAHENEMEAFVVAEGGGEYYDDGTFIRLSAGDVTLTVSGQGHSVKNDTDADLVLLALILHKN